MKTVKLGGKEVNPIGIGTWMMGGGIYEDKVTFADYSNDERDVAAIKYAISKGQNHIDTAQMYGAGHSEEIVGQAIKDTDRSKLFIASKVWRSHALANAVPYAASEMLKRLQTDYLDLLYIHAPWEEFLPMEEYMVGLNAAVDQGLTKTIGVSNFNLDQLKRAVKLSKNPIVANQIHYNILNKGLATKEMLEYCLKNNIRIVAYRPVERKLLADQAENPTVKEIAAKYKKTPAQIALNWLISQQNVVAIPKASDPKHIDENLGALDFEIEKFDITRLDELNG